MNLSPSRALEKKRKISTPGPTSQLMRFIDKIEATGGLAQLLRPYLEVAK